MYEDVERKFRQEGTVLPELNPYDTPKKYPKKIKMINIKEKVLPYLSLQAIASLFLCPFLPFLPQLCSDSLEAECLPPINHC